MAISTTLHTLTVFTFLLARFSLAAQFNSSSLLRKYDLVTGRRTACPRSVSIRGISDNGEFVSAQSMSANGLVCKGVGGKAIREGTALLTQGLRLPSLVTVGDVVFFAAVETAPRTCGRWSFNASVVSWFVYKPRSGTMHKDEASGLEIEPGFAYVTYEHFADFCAFRSKVEEEFITPTPESVEDVDEGTAATDSEDGEGGGGGESDGGDGDAGGDGGEVGSDGSGETTSDVGTSEGTRRECFPAAATVQLSDGSVKRMDDLQVGDRVLSSTNGDFSDVYFFSHCEKHVSAVFVRLETVSKKSLSVTSGHFIYLDGIVTPAGKARVGMMLSLRNGTAERIVGVRWVKAMGLFNPHTHVGDIVVNDVLTTTWTTAVSPNVAESLLSPIRLNYYIQPGWVHKLMGQCLRWFFKGFQEVTLEEKHLRTFT